MRKWKRFTEVYDWDDDEFQLPETEWRQARRRHDIYGIMFDRIDYEYDVDDPLDSPWQYDSHLHDLVAGHAWIRSMRKPHTNFYHGPTYFMETRYYNPDLDILLLDENLNKGIHD